MATIEELTEWLGRQEEELVEARCKVLWGKETAGTIEDRERLWHLANRYGHFLDVITCVQRFLKGEESNLCQD